METAAGAYIADWATAPTRSASRRGPSRLHIYTHNVFGLPFTQRERRFRALAELISELAPDVAFLQEVLFAGDEKLFQIDGYHSASVPNGLLNSGGLLTLCRVPLTQVRFRPFSAQGAWHTLQLTDRFLRKGWLEAEASDWGITLVNTHLVSTYVDSQRFVHDPDQLSQLDQVLRKVDLLGPSVLAGDFNFTDGTPFHRMAQARVEDVAKGLHPWPLGHPLPKLDHVFVRRLDWSESRAKRVLPGTLNLVGGTRALSDHAGVSVELEMGWEDTPYPATA